MARFVISTGIADHLKREKFLMPLEKMEFLSYYRQGVVS